MATEALNPRSVTFAYLFGPPRHVPRDEAARIHAAVCDRLGFDDISFLYKNEPGAGQQADTCGLACSRSEGREVFQFAVESRGLQAPMRLYLSNPWPGSLEEVQERFDATSEAVFEALDGEWHNVLAETRIRAHCSAGGGDGAGYIRDTLLRAPAGWLGADPALASCSIKYKLDAEDPASDPARELSIEPLQADPTCLYLELISRWTCTRGTKDKQQLLTTIEGKPSDYIRDSYAFLLENELPKKKGAGAKNRVRAAQEAAK
ncbi:MAG: hypothetical protein AAF581_08040 [Planctomycetota bacterium]